MRIFKKKTEKKNLRLQKYLVTCGRGLRLAKQQLCTCITLFSTFLLRHFTTTTWKLPNFTSYGPEDINKRRRNLSLNLDMVQVGIQLQESSPKFDKVSELEWLQWRFKERKFTFLNTLPSWDLKNPSYWRLATAKLTSGSNKADQLFTCIAHFGIFLQQRSMEDVNTRQWILV